MGADMHIKHYWQTHGTRRPFPALYKAVELYGRDAVMYSKPRYEAKGQCPWCGGAVESKRRRFCSDDCRREFDLRTVWQRGRDPYSLRILYRDNFTWCEKVIDSPDPGITRDCDHYRILTNADQIRNVSDEALAVMLNETIAEWACPPRKEYTKALCGDSPDCNKCWLKWLHAEAEL